MRHHRPAGVPRTRATSLIGAFLAISVSFTVATRGESSDTLHYTPNRNFASDGGYLPGKAGFNLADVSRVDQLKALSPGVKALVWVGQCNGVDTEFLKTVRPFAGKPAVFGFFLMDDPDPRLPLSPGGFSHSCSPKHLMAESDWIHANMRGAKTLVTLMNLSSSETPSYKNTYNPANSHIDLFGVDAYPCRSELGGCDYDMIDRYVDAATVAGIPIKQIVPFYQVFGGGAWKDDAEGQYLLPTPDQERQIIARWRNRVKTPSVDAAYSWGSQRADTSLESDAELQDVFKAHNRATP
jgi:hypothetical protein